MREEKRSLRGKELQKSPLFVATPPSHNTPCLPHTELENQRSSLERQRRNFSVYSEV